MENGLRDDGTHRWQRVLEHGSFTRPMPCWVCVDCNRWARVDEPGFTWGPTERPWQRTSQPRDCNAALRTERLARVRAIAQDEENDPTCPNGKPWCGSDSDRLCGECAADRADYAYDEFRDEV